MKKKGFTLIELLIVMAIVGILAAIFLPPIMKAFEDAPQKSEVVSPVGRVK